MTNARTGSIVVGSWSAALLSPTRRVTWHSIDSNCNVRCIPITILIMTAAVTLIQEMRCIIEEVLEQNPFVGSDDIRVYTATIDNEVATALAVDLLTNLVGSVRFVGHTLSLAVDVVFEDEMVWGKYLQHTNTVATYFYHHQKAAKLLSCQQ